MRRALRRGAMVAAVCGLALAGLAAAPQQGTPAVDPGGQQLASIQRLKSQAMHEALAGHFDTTDLLLVRAASLSHDPTVEQMASWSSDFKTQLQAFAKERHKQYEEMAAQVRLLVQKGKPDYAMDLARTVYVLTDDKQKFHDEPWVVDLLRSAANRAEQYDRSEQWIKSLRLYAALSAIEESTPVWKEKLKLATRRVRLLAVYTPDVFKALQESETKERDEVEQLLHPATQPSTQPSKKDERTATDTFKIDWHETLHGVQMNMLWEALTDADQNYFRQISYRDMALGGLNGLRTVVTTKGLEAAFPKLADADRRAEFLAALDKAVADNQNALRTREQETLRQTLIHLRVVNTDTVGLPVEVLVSEFADGAFEKLDPFTSMIWPSDLEEFNKTTQGKFSGVGIQIQSDEDGSLKVVSPLEDTPAYKAGIKAGDVVTHIDGKSAKGISINQAVRTITGPPNTTVKLTVKSPNGLIKDYTIRRETIHVASVKGYLHRPGGGWDYLVDPKQKIGYIRITNFTSDTSNELNTAIDTMKLQHVRGIIMDLRYNPGGLLTAATEVVDKFLDHGVIVSTRPDRDNGNSPTVAVAKPDEGDCDLPLVVLVNQYSASASEIVSGALKDDKMGDKPRAVIVGERTFGKGSVQMLFPLTDRTAYLKLTTSHYYLPSGRCIHREENSKEWGVEPDVKVEMTPDQMRAAIDARQDLDILRDVAPAGGAQPKLNESAKNANTKPDTSNARKDLLARDPQLSAGLLLLRLQLSGAQS